MEQSEYVRFFWAIVFNCLKFQASTLDQSHHLLGILSCKHACKNLVAVSARPAVCFFQPILQLNKKSSQTPLPLRFYICTLLMYTNTRLIEAEQQVGSKTPTSEVGFLENLRAYKTWTLLLSNFWATNWRMQLINVNARAGLHNMHPARTSVIAENGANAQLRTINCHSKNFFWTTTKHTFAWIQLSAANYVGRFGLRPFRVL